MFSHNTVVVFWPNQIPNSIPHLNKLPSIKPIYTCVVPSLCPNMRRIALLQPNRNFVFLSTAFALCFLVTCELYLLSVRHILFTIFTTGSIYVFLLATKRIKATHGCKNHKRKIHTHIDTFHFCCLKQKEHMHRVSLILHEFDAVIYVIE